MGSGEEPRRRPTRQVRIGDMREDICLKKLSRVNKKGNLVAYVRIDVEVLIIEHSRRKLHHLCENEKTLESMSNLFGNELDKVRDKLVDAWVIPHAC